MSVGANAVSVVVTAEDGETTKTYTVTVTRAKPPVSTDATLGSLALSDAPFTFASDTTSYDVNVANDVDQTTVTATANDDGATYVVKLDDTVDEDGTVDLSIGANAVGVVVTAEDGNTNKTYTVAVTRAGAPAPEPAVAIELSSGSVEEGMEISVTMSFANLTPAYPSAPTCPAIPRPPGSGPRQERIFWLQSVGPPLTGRRTPPRRHPAWTHSP